jgi:hypothetical protein
MTLLLCLFCALVIVTILIILFVADMFSHLRHNIGTVKKLNQEIVALKKRLSKGGI